MTVLAEGDKFFGMMTFLALIIFTIYRAAPYPKASMVLFLIYIGGSYSYGFYQLFLRLTHQE